MITTGIPSNIRRPGTFHRFVEGLAGGLVALESQVIVVGIKSAAGTATVAAPIRIYDEADADTKLGKGSEAALMARIAFAQARRGGRGCPEIWACPIAAPSGAAATQTITATVTTAQAGNVVFRIAGRTITAGVSAGDAQNTIAAAIEAAIDTLAATGDLPVTASVAANVVTCVHANLGVNGNDVDYEIVSYPSGVTVATTQSVAGSGVVDITAALDALSGINEFVTVGIAIANHLAADTADVLAHLVESWGPTVKKWRHIFIGETGSVSTANGLADDIGHYGALVASCENSPSLPGELAAVVAVSAIAKATLQPNANLNGEVLVTYPPPAASAYTNTEIETLLAGGTTPIVPTANGVETKIVRLVTTQVLLNGATYNGHRDFAVGSVNAFLARQLDIGWAQKFHQEVIDGDDAIGGPSLLDRARDMVVEVHRDCERRNIIRNVDSFLPDIIVEESTETPGRLAIADPYLIAMPLHQAAFVHTHYHTL